MIQWKQHLYAFLLRRILGPFLDASSYQKLHDSIDVSLQEGTFILKDVGLNADHLTEKIVLKNPGLVICQAKVKHLEISFTLRENVNDNNNDPEEQDSEVPQSSFAWRAMKFGTSSAAIPAVSLMAVIKVDGICLELEAGDHPKRHRPTIPSTNNSATDDEPSSKSLIGSYVDAALASLELSLNVTKINITVRQKNAEKSSEAWVALRLSSISYQDLDISRNKESSGSKSIFKKVVQCSEIEIQSGEQQLEDDTVKNNTQSTVALARGSGQVHFRVFEYSNSGPSAKCHVQQDIEVKLNHQVNLSLDMKSISQIKSVLDGLAYASKIDDQNDTTEISQTSLAGSPLDIDDVTDQEDLKALSGIMKQYREAYHLAEKNQLKGGVLIPSNAYLDGIPLPEEEDAGSFDLFFDANDQSFYNATSVLAESIRIQETSDDTDDLINTKVRFHLLSTCLKIGFREPGTTHYSRPGEYILLTMDDLNLSHASSHSSSESTLSIAHVEIEDAQLDTTKKSSGFVSIGGAPVFEGVIDIGTLVGFSSESNEGEKNDLLVFDAPCLSMNVKKKRKNSAIDSIKCDATVLPIEVCIRQRTLSNLSSFAAQLRALKSESGCTTTQSATLDATRKQHVSFQCSCPSITIGVPLVQKVSTSPIFERNGEMLNNAPIKRPSLGLLLQNTAFEWVTGPAEDGNDSLEEAGRFMSHNMLFFVQSPVGDKIVLDANMQRTDILMASGRLEVNPCIPISIELKRNVGGSKIGRDSFPLVPAISSFKARQEDDDEDIKIDRLLFSKLNDVNADSRKDLRGSDPQFAMVADAKKADFVVVLNIPEITADFTKSEMESLLNILAATKPEPPSPTTVAPSQDAEDGRVQGTCFALNISKITLSLNEDPAAGGHCQHQDTFSCVFAVDNFKAHALLQGSSMKHLRLLAHEPCLYEVYHTAAQYGKQESFERDVQTRVDCFGQRMQSFSSGLVSPVVYRSHLFTSISHESPTFLFDFIDLSTDKRNKTSGFAEKRLHVTFYHLTYRCDIDSKWIERLAGILPRTKDDAADETNSQSVDQTTEGIQSMTKVYFSLADFNLDYTPPEYFETTSRSILRIGDFRFSSIIMKPSTKTQAYSLSLGDLAFHVCNHKYPYDGENSLLPRSSLMWNAVGKPTIKATPSTSMPTLETLLRELGFVRVLSLDMMDAIIVVREKTGGSAPKLMTSLTFGTLSMNACKDAFSCFASTVGEFNAKLTALTDDDINALSMESTGGFSRNAERPKPSSQADITSNPLTADHFASHSTKIQNNDDEINLLDGYEWTAIDHDPLPEPKIPDGDEQFAGWYNSSKTLDPKGPLIGGSVTPRIKQQHFPLHAISDPLSDGDMGASKFAGNDANLVLKSRLMIHQLTVKFRFYDGYDWPEKMSPEQSKAATRSGASFVIETLPDLERLQLKEALSKNDAIEESRKAKLLGDLLAAPEEASSTFSSAPLPEERATNIELKEKVRRFSRKSHLFFQLSANGVTLRTDSYEKDTSHRLVNILALSVSDLFIAETASRPSPIKMLGEWVNDNEHPHDSRFGTLMFKMVAWHPANRITADNEVESDDCEVTIQLLPMRCILDQRAINFIRSFFYSEEIEGTNSEIWSSGLHYLPPPRFRAFRVKPWKLKVDYLPQKLDIAALREGSFVELVNVSPIDSMVITLSQACVENVVGFGLVGSGLVRRWVQEICATQLHKFIANARPFEPFADVGQGVTDLIVLPYEAFKNGDDIRQAMGSGIKSLAETFAFQTLTTTSRLTQYAANKMAGTVRGRRRVNVALNPLPSRPSSAPKGVSDVTGHAMESLARGIQAANYKVVIVPYREYARNGATGAATSVLKGIPVLLVAPLTGATEALSYTLLGARNALRPDIRKEEEAIRNGITGYDI